jgi:anti-sigma factor RsiW
MNCTEVRDIIQLYLDSELNARSTLNVLRHLEHCSGCSRLFHRYLGEKARLRQAARSEAINSQRLRGRIVWAIRKEAAGSRYQWICRELRRHIALLRLGVVTTAHRER